MKSKSSAWILIRILVPFAVVSYLLYKAWSDGLDFRVYWAGAHAFVSGGDLYAPGLPGTLNGGMAFTYAPFAAAIFAPMALLPLKAAMLLHAISSVLIAGFLGWVTTQFLVAKGVLILPPSRVQFALTASFISALILFTGPWRETLALGQINPLLMGLIVFDLLVSTRKHPNGFIPRGILTGISAGIKLTPLVFLMYFVMRGDFKSAARMVATFGATVAVMWIAFPALSAKYWLSALGNTDRVGSLAVYENISLRGVVARLGFGDSVSNILWASASAVVIALGALAVRRLSAAGDNWSAVSATAIVMLLISPVSWNHHWVWVVVVIPAIIGKWATRRRDRFNWLDFSRSYAGCLAVFTAAGFALGASLAVRLTGSRPFESVSVFSQFVAELGMFAAILALCWFAVASTEQRLMRGQALEPSHAVN